jgi:hypothetical protein
MSTAGSPAFGFEQVNCEGPCSFYRLSPYFVNNKLYNLHVQLYTPLDGIETVFFRTRKKKLPSNTFIHLEAFVSRHFLLVLLLIFKYLFTHSTSSTLMETFNLLPNACSPQSTKSIHAFSKHARVQ